MEKNTAKTFVLQLGSLIALYVSITALVILLFGVINLRFPDEAAYYWEDEGARQSIRAAIAMLIVFFPTFIALTRINNQARRRESSGHYTGLTKWVIYLSLLVGGGIMLGDLVTVINYFLNGEITTRFLLKAFVLFAIICGAFAYYMHDVKGYFQKEEKKSIYAGIIASIVVLASVISGVAYIETPKEVREMRLDEQQIQDLQTIQFRIEEYYAVRDGFPESIDDLFIDERAPTAPSGRPEYRYILTGERTYQLCATFAAESTDRGGRLSIAAPVKEINYNWDHGVGETCFERVIQQEVPVRP